MPLRIIVCGARGRMGQRVIALAHADDRFQVIAGVDRLGEVAKGFLALSGKDLPEHLRRADAVIDFSSPAASVSFAKAAARARKPIVIGTTGFSPAQLSQIKACAKRTPVFLSPNFSPGMNLLFYLAQRAAAALPDYDAGIHEIHHTKKKDAPSGSAFRLADAVRQGNGRKVPIVSERLGTVVGDHALVLAGSGERLELKHHAESRDVFARGALDASLWASKKAPGLYDMRKMLGLP